MSDDNLTIFSRNANFTSHCCDGVQLFSSDYRVSDERRNHPSYKGQFISPDFPETAILSAPPHTLMNRISLIDIN